MKVLAAVLALACACPALRVRADDTPPSPPLIQDARVYSATAAEIFWQRSTDDRGVRGYEVKRDSRVLGVFDALSYFDDTLRPRTRYVYCVTAIDTAGQRTSAGCTTVFTLDDGIVDRDGPEPVSGLRGTIYSNTAAGIAWDRGANSPRYEVRRDGEVLFITSGGSYIPTDLMPGTPYVIEIVTIDSSSGERSPPARITISTEPRSVTVDPAGSPDEPPGPPEDISIRVYSPTAAELFWTRAPRRERVRNTEVRRDGVLIATVPGNSFYDDTREPGIGYVYELTAIDADGLRSEPSVFLGGDGSITTANWEPLLRSVAPFLGAEPLEAFRDRLDALARELVSLAHTARDDGAASGLGATFVSSEEGVDEGTEFVRYDFVCDAGGTLSVTDEALPASGQPVRVRLNFCILDDMTASGLDSFRDGLYADVVLSREAFHVTDVGFYETDRVRGESYRLSGQRRVEPPRGSFGWYGGTQYEGTGSPAVSDYEVEWTRLRYGYDSPERTYSVMLPDGSTARVVEGRNGMPTSDRVSVEGRFTIEGGPLVGEGSQPLDVEVALRREGRLLEWLPEDDPGYPLAELGPVVEAIDEDGAPVSLDLRSPDTIEGWSSGTLTVFAQNGSSLLVTPLEGVPERFVAEVPYSGRTFEREWADGFLSCPVAPGLYCGEGDDAP